MERWGASAQRPQPQSPGRAASWARYRVILDVAVGEALAGLLGEVEDVAGHQLDGLDHAHGVDCGPPIAEVVENHVCADGKCKTD